MAIGLGRMFGFRFLENFNYPYFATSMTDFWRRWHISLSTLVSRLPLHPPRRQPSLRRRADTQPAHRVLAVRPVARRELELRRSGDCSTARS